MKPQQRKARKTKIVTDIFKRIQDSHHRRSLTGFVNYDEATEAWYQVGIKAAREKIGHAFRTRQLQLERASESKKNQEEEEAVREAKRIKHFHPFPLRSDAIFGSDDDGPKVANRGSVSAGSVQQSKTLFMSHLSTTLSRNRLRQLLQRELQEPSLVKAVPGLSTQLSDPPH